MIGNLNKKKILCDDMIGTNYDKCNSIKNMWRGVEQMINLRIIGIVVERKAKHRRNKPIESQAAEIKGPSTDP